MKIIAWVEDHPYESAGIIAGALALILIIVHYKNAASSAASNAMPQATGTDPAIYQAQTQAYEQSQALASQASQYATGAATAEKIAEIQAGVSSTNTGLAAGVQTAGISAQEAVQLASIQSNNTIAGIQADLEKTIAGLQAGAQNNQTAASSATEQSLITALTPNSGQAASNSNWVKDEYNVILGRAPSNSEIAYYTNLEASGTSEATIQQYFLNSPEYKKKIGATS